MSAHANHTARFACLTSDDVTGVLAVPAAGVGAELAFDATDGFVMLRNPEGSGETVFIGSASADDANGLPLAPGGVENLPVTAGLTLFFHAAGAVDIHYRKVKVGS